MIETTGDIWRFENTHLIVVPTNIGWKHDGRNVMGAGLASDAETRWGVAQWYGEVCRAFLDQTPVMRYFCAPILCFPVKPLNLEAPWKSWMGRANLPLIRRSLRQLRNWPGGRKIAVPMVGCGNGGLDRADVYPVLRSYLFGDRFVLVRRR